MIYYCTLLHKMVFLKFSWSQLQQLVGADIEPLWILAQTDFSRRWGISVKSYRLPLSWLHADLYHLDQLHTNLFHAVSGHWVSPAWMEPTVGSRTAQQSSGACPSPISPQDRRKRCPFITQVCLARNNVKVEHGYSPFLPVYVLLTPPPKTQWQTRSVPAFLPTFLYTGQNYVEICNNKIRLSIIITHYYEVNNE